MGFRLNRMDLQIILFCKLEEVRGFAAKTGASVKVYPSHAKRAKQAGCKLGGLILYLKKTF